VVRKTPLTPPTSEDGGETDLSKDPAGKTKEDPAGKTPREETPGSAPSSVGREEKDPSVVDGTPSTSSTPLAGGEVDDFEVGEALTQGLNEDPPVIDNKSSTDEETNKPTNTTSDGGEEPPATNQPQTFITVPLSAEDDQSPDSDLTSSPATDTKIEGTKPKTVTSTPESDQNSDTNFNKIPPKADCVEISGSEPATIAEHTESQSRDFHETPS
ncbi:MAG: hypothetical protein GY818_10400, partial [Planctomycetaceae bacterium]|nr:hypothetical protein [Planctomycetaceae bacterium]